MLFPLSSLTSSAKAVCCGDLEGDFDDEGGGGSFSLRWINDGLLEEVFGGLGKEEEVGCGCVEDVFIDFQPSIDTLRL